jgi:hypothetical protein
MNRALIDLGITGYRVDSIEKEKEAVSNRDVDNYVVTIVSTVESSKTHSGALTP